MPDRVISKVFEITPSTNFAFCKLRPSLTTKISTHSFAPLAPWENSFTAFSINIAFYIHQSLSSYTKFGLSSLMKLLEANH
jgi:hypothetical protein